MALFDTIVPNRYHKRIKGPGLQTPACHAGVTRCVVIAILDVNWVHAPGPEAEAEFSRGVEVVLVPHANDDGPFCTELRRPARTPIERGMLHCYKMSITVVPWQSI